MAQCWVQIGRHAPPRYDAAWNAVADYDAVVVVVADYDAGWAAAVKKAKSCKVTTVGSQKQKQN